MRTIVKEIKTCSINVEYVSRQAALIMGMATIIIIALCLWLADVGFFCGIGLFFADALSFFAGVVCVLYMITHSETTLTYKGKSVRFNLTDENSDTFTD